MLALLLPLPEARHVHGNGQHIASPSPLFIGNHNPNSDSGIDSAAANDDDVLPAWHANPFHDLEQSFGQASYDMDSSISSIGSSSDSDSGSSSSSDEFVRAIWRMLRRQRLRHRRSHNLRYFTNPDTAPEWENPCGGVYQPIAPKAGANASSGQGRVIKRKHLEVLMNNVKQEHQFMQRTARIAYEEFQPWANEYKFLPNMTRNTNPVKLKTWYRNMQTFVASFAYLGRSQYKYRKQHQQRLSESTLELHELLLSARRVLCDIETTINASYPNTNEDKLTTVSRATMLERLHLHTLANGEGAEDADERDLQITKQLYFQYLDNTWKTLRRTLRKSQRHSMERKQKSAQAAARAASFSRSSAAGSSSRSAESGDSSSIVISGEALK
ncbi:uncharacterized protein LOC115627681 [Scaptodrosophila lebanonensis]|uniref:Uncharacterized protein LOC115627681 n=1 Tax=Drosophila lebanonensis TaxID=7225 RepID=A0A6J2TT89_DROLE|nr:uncharacterized protein LOC115627681 [Scaptodrosophila lebanonensis]